MTSDPQQQPTRPALKTLLADQRELFDVDAVESPTLAHDLRGGFPHRRAAIEWYQRAIVRTFGFIADEWPPESLYQDWTLVGSLITTEARANWADLSDEAAQTQRYRLERQIVDKACTRAYNKLRTSAGEYIDEEEGEVDTEDLHPEEQAHVAMRPSFQQKDAEQAATLEELWGGFDDELALMDWLRELTAATNGAVDADLPQKVGDDDIALTHLISGQTDPAGARRYRERFAIGVLLPAFEKGIKRMDAGELAKRRRTGAETFNFE